MMRVLVATLVLLAGAGMSCDVPGPYPRQVTAVEYGRELFNTTALSSSRFNAFSCATCHATSSEGPTMIAGRSLEGVTQRTRWFGGMERDLLSAVNFCLVYFMRGERLGRDDERGKALYEYLASISPGRPPDGLRWRPMTVVGNVSDVPRGDPGRGAVVYAEACQSCHGAIHDGAGRLTELAPVLPEVRSEYDALFPGVSHALVFVEKVRHGQFYGVGGNMPFFARETLSDEDLGALLTFLGL
ncbi:MAG: c-type cytochrome [Myxococcota bacterium]